MSVSRRPRVTTTIDPETGKLLAVIRDLYGSAMDGTPEIWNKIFRRCGQLLDSEVGGFVSTNKVNQAADLASLIGFDRERAIQAYQEFGVEADLIFMGTQEMKSGTTFLGNDLLGQRALQESPFYEVLARPAGVDHFVGGIVENDSEHHSALYFWRPVGHAEFDRRSRDILALIMPHVRQALEVQRRIRGSQLDATPARALNLATFQASRHGVFVLDEAGRILFANTEGERIVRSGDGVSARGGRLHVDNPLLSAEIDRMMFSVTRMDLNAGLAPIAPIRVPRQSGALSYEWLVIPVTGGDQRAILPPNAAFLVAITDPAAFTTISRERLQSYGLTGAEARLCQALLRTGSLPDAADDLNISWSTARSHLKHVFAKLGVTSQIQLVTSLIAGYFP